MKLVGTIEVACLLLTYLIPMGGAFVRIFRTKPASMAAEQFAGTLDAGLMVWNLLPLWAKYARI